MNNLSPIVLFVYNRPWHTRETLKALMANELADQSRLIIYSDGPKENSPNEQRDKIMEVRKLIREKQWCGLVEIIESDTNKGLANSIISGVTEVVNKYGKIIVLEDDIVTSKGFLRYMNEALTLYRDKENVMHISAYWPNVIFKSKVEETFFLKFMSCWGWATWKDSWDNLICDVKKLYDLLKDNKKDFNLSNTNNSFKQIKQNISGKINTWAIKWYASIYLNNGLCLHPYKSLVQNIGTDGSGIHYNEGKTDQYKTKIADNISVVEINNITENKIARKSLERFYCRLKFKSLFLIMKKKTFKLFRKL